MAEDELTPPARDALRVLGVTRGRCPSPEALLAYHATVAGARTRDPIDAHVEVCSRCQLVLLHLDEPTVTGSKPVTRWMLPLAAAVALVMLGPWLYRSTMREPVIDTIRGTELQPIAPVGAVPAVDRFEWQSPVTAAKYRVTVTRAGQPVWSTESASTRAAPLFLPALEPGVDYEWRVEAIDAEGSVRMSSPTTRFRLPR